MMISTAFFSIPLILFFLLILLSLRTLDNATFLVACSLLDYISLLGIQALCQRSLRVKRSSSDLCFKNKYSILNQVTRFRLIFKPTSSPLQSTILAFQRHSQSCYALAGSSWLNITRNFHWGTL
jgi:hypothetical protein